MKRFQFLMGFLCGALLIGGLTSAATAASGMMAKLSNQAVYVDGKQVRMEAYMIHDNNFVQLRDIGKAVGFNVYWDGSAVQIESDKPYTGVAPSGQTPTALTEENVQAAIRALRDTYPNNTPYDAPYIPNNPLDRPFSNCDHCAGWAMKCSDVAFGNLPYRQITKPNWDEIRVGDLVEWRTDTSGHVVVVLEKTDEYIKVTESGITNKAYWGGQYFKWWLEEQPGLTLYTRYPQ